jgi:hypothetical protein
MNANTSSNSLIGGGNISYTLGVGFVNDMALAVILCQPDETRTMHLLCRTLAISNCSANVRSDKTKGTSPSHIPLANAYLGTLLADNDL